MSFTDYTSNNQFPLWNVNYLMETVQNQANQLKDQELQAEQLKRTVNSLMMTVQTCEKRLECQALQIEQVKKLCTMEKGFVSNGLKNDFYAKERKLRKLAKVAKKQNDDEFSKMPNLMTPDALHENCTEQLDDPHTESRKRRRLDNEN